MRVKLTKPLPLMSWYAILDEILVGELCLELLEQIFPEISV